MRQRSQQRIKAKTVQMDRPNEAAIRYAFLLLLAGLLIGQLLLLIGP